MKMNMQTFARSMENVCARRFVGLGNVHKEGNAPHAHRHGKSVAFKSIKLRIVATVVYQVETRTVRKRQR